MGGARTRLHHTNVIQTLVVCKTRRPVSRKSRELFGLGELFCVCCIYIQDQSFKNFNNDTMKLSVNKAKLTGL